MALEGKSAGWVKVYYQKDPLRCGWFILLSDMSDNDLKCIRPTTWSNAGLIPLKTTVNVGTNKTSPPFLLCFDIHNAIGVESKTKLPPSIQGQQFMQFGPAIKLLEHKDGPSDNAFGQVRKQGWSCFWYNPLDLPGSTEFQASKLQQLKYIRSPETKTTLVQQPKKAVPKQPKNAVPDQFKFTIPKPQSAAAIDQVAIGQVKLPTLWTERHSKLLLLLTLPKVYDISESRVYETSSIKMYKPEEYDQKITTVLRSLDPCMLTLYVQKWKSVEHKVLHPLVSSTTYSYCTVLDIGPLDITDKQYTNTLTKQTLDVSTLINVYAPSFKDRHRLIKELYTKAA